MPKKVYKLVRRYGEAVVAADSPEEALTLLKDYEKDEYLTHRTTAENMREIPIDEKGIISYNAH